MSRPADARIRSVIEVETLVGSGVPGDPARVVTTYRDTDGTLLAHRDPWLTSDGLRAFFVAHGWAIDTGTGPSPEPFDALANLHHPYQEEE